MKRKLVFVTEHGNGKMDGSAPENACPLAEGLGMTKYEGGTIVICGPITFDELYAFPSNYAPITVTSVYGGIDYRKKGAKLLLKDHVYLYGDYTFTGIRLSAAENDLYIFMQYNNVTFGDDVVCTLERVATTRIGLYCGYDAQSASYRNSSWESCRKDGKAVICSGAWRFVRGGNLRAAIGDQPGSPLRSVFGTVKPDVRYVISVLGGSFEGANGDYSALTGMNSVHGEVFMQINGGRFASPLYFVCEGGENPDALERTVCGNLTLQINGGEFKEAKIIKAYGDEAEASISKDAILTLSIDASLFDSIESDGVEKIKGNTNAPEIRDNKEVFTKPPYPDTPPTREPFTAEMEEKLGEQGKERLKVIRGLAEMDGSDLFPEWRVLDDPENKYNLKAVESIKFINMLSGEYSINRTQTNYGVASVGGGYMVDCKDFVMFAFGDTMREDGVGLPWRANMLAHSTDFDYTDGILFDGFYSVDSGEYANQGGEFLLSAHKKNVEMSKIPTGAVYVNGNVYWGFMSVNRWQDPDVPGTWKCNYGGLAKSTDLGRTFEMSSDLRWPEESGYAQLHPVLDGDYVYIFAVPGGRARSCKLMRVHKDEIENFEAYEYLVCRDENGKGIFKKGRDAMYSDFYVVGERVGGVGVMYNEYLGEWVMMYCTGKAGRINRGAIVMRVAKTLDGEWSDAVLVASQPRFGTVYEPRICSRYVKDGGKHMMLISSKWEIYNSLVWDIELSRKDEPEK